MKRYFTFLFLFLLTLTLSGCCVRSYKPMGPNARGANVNEKDVSAITRHIWVYSEKMKYEKGMKLLDSAVCYDDNNYTNIFLEYCSMATLDLCAARKELVDVVEGFIKEMGDTAGGGFSADNIHLVLRFQSFYNYYDDLQMVGLAVLDKGISDFYAGDAIQCDPFCWHKRTEPYGLSYEIVTYQKEGEKLYAPKEKDFWAETGRFFSLDNVPPSKG